VSLPSAKSQRFAPQAAAEPAAKVPTSSLRRVCQVRAARADLSVEILRGNVDTRLRKLAAGEVDALVLAAAGLALADAGVKGNAELLAQMDMVVAAGGGERDIARRAPGPGVASADSRLVFEVGPGGAARRRRFPA